MCHLLNFYQLHNKETSFLPISTLLLNLLVFDTSYRQPWYYFTLFISAEIQRNISLLMIMLSRYISPHKSADNFSFNTEETLNSLNPHCRATENVFQYKKKYLCKMWPCRRLTSKILFSLFLIISIPQRHLMQT